VYSICSYALGKQKITRTGGVCFAFTKIGYLFFFLLRCNVKRGTRPDDQCSKTRSSNFPFFFCLYWFHSPCTNWRLYVCICGRLDRGKCKLRLSNLKMCATQKMRSRRCKALCFMESRMGDISSRFRFCKCMSRLSLSNRHLHAAHVL
jgi:hypothetical protein